MALPVISAEELRFVEEYVKDRNATRAALEAGLSPTYFGAATKAKELLKNAQIKTWIKFVHRVQARRLKTAIPQLLREWAILGTSDVTDFELSPEGRLTVRPGVPRSALRAVKKSKVTRTETLRGRGDGTSLTVEYKSEIELHDKIAPLKALYEHFHGELPGEDKAAAGIEAMGRLAALLAGKLAQLDGSG